MPEELSIEELWQLAASLQQASDECLLRANTNQNALQRSNLLINANEFARESDRVAGFARMLEVICHA